jgi:hypothetical protein
MKTWRVAAWLAYGEAGGAVNSAPAAALAAKCQPALGVSESYRRRWHSRLYS